ncbi:hypothetical protein ACWGQ5_11255 [Streptomyces sp. NPDC055722]
MMTDTRPRMPAEFGDDLLRAIHRETSWSVPLAERTTCPIHLNWADRCRHLHVRKAGH